MSKITRKFYVDGVLTDMTSVKLSDAAAAYGVKRDDTGAVVVADDTAMTKTDTGTYEYTFTDPANDLTYTYSVEFVYDGETTHIGGDMTGPTSAASSGSVNFTVESLCQHLRSELDVDPNAAGGSIPDRVRTLVTLAGMELWDGHDWAFKRRQGTLTTVANTATVDFPVDFHELDQRWLRDADESVGVRFTSDPTEYQRIANDYESGDTGAPIIACIQRKTPSAGVTDYVLQALLSPTPDAVYNYPYWYMVLNPWSASDIGDTTSPIWPHTFNEGWRLFAKQKLLHAYGGSSKDDALIGAACKRWIADQLAENDEMLSRPNERIRDGYGDFAPRPFSVVGMTGRNFYDY